MDREGGQGGSALAIQISQASWTDVCYLSIYHLGALQGLVPSLPVCRQDGLSIMHSP